MDAIDAVVDDLNQSHRTKYAGPGGCYFLPARYLLCVIGEGLVAPLARVGDYNR